MSYIYAYIYLITVPIYGYICAYICPIATPIYGYVYAYICPIAVPIYGYICAYIYLICCSHVANVCAYTCPICCSYMAYICPHIWPMYTRIHGLFTAPMWLMYYARIYTLFAAPMWPMYAPIYGPCMRVYIPYCCSYMAHICAHVYPNTTPIWPMYTPIYTLLLLPNMAYYYSKIWPITALVQIRYKAWRFTAFLIVLIFIPLNRVCIRVYINHIRVVIGYIYAYI